jgi:predicted RNase H-like HicB family nuclease
MTTPNHLKPLCELTHIEALARVQELEQQMCATPLTFGMRGPKMTFSVGVQSFALDYEPVEPEEFEFMSTMLTKAIGRIETADLHLQLAHETLRADQGWQRYESANADRNVLRTERAGMVEILDGVAKGLDFDTGVLWSNLPALARALRRGQVYQAAQLKTIREHASGFACYWGMTEAHQELAGKPIPDSATVFHFMGSGASTAVQAHEIRRMLDTIYGTSGLATETPDQTARGERYEDAFVSGLLDIEAGRMALSYPATFTPDVLEFGAAPAGFVVTFRDIPEATSQGDDETEAKAMAADALVSALDFYFEDQRSIPEPSAPLNGEHMIALPADVAQRVTLHNRRLEQAP